MDYLQMFQRIISTTPPSHEFSHAVLDFLDSSPLDDSFMRAANFLRSLIEDDKITRQKEKKG